jgi:hypothetical protein
MTKGTDDKELVEKLRAEAYERDDTLLEQAADRIEQLSSALTDARDAIAGLEPDALGMAQIPFGTTGVDMYPIRDELLAKIVSALQSLQVGGE